MASTEATALARRIEERAQQQDFKLPVFNPVAIKLQRLMQSDVNMAAIEALIVKDAGLASEILRKANTAYFAGMKPAEELRGALVRLGLSRARSVVFMASQEQAFRAKDVRLNAAMNRLWLHSMVAAVVARALANESDRREIAETAFLAALLHDIGSLVIVKVIDEMLAEGALHCVDDAQLDELVRLLHTDFGHKVLASWGLPKQLVEIARDHDLAQYEDNTLLDVVRMVDALLLQRGIAQSADAELPLAELPEAQRLGLCETVIASLAEQADAARDQALATAIGRG